MTSAPQSHSAISQPRASADFTPLTQLRQSPPHTLRNPSRTASRTSRTHYPGKVLPADYSPMAEPAGPTQLSDEAIKLIQDFAKWLSTTKPTDWDEKSDGIYVCNHSQLAKEIQNLKENLVSTKFEKKEAYTYYIRNCLTIQWCSELSSQRFANLPHQVAVLDFAFFVVDPRQY